MEILAHLIGMSVSRLSFRNTSVADLPACLNTAIGIAVFLEDGDTYDHAMTLFQQAVPSVIYLESDGSLPHAARGQSSSAAALKSRWFDQQSFGNSGQSGQIQASSSF